MKKTVKKLDIVVQGWLEEQKKKRASGEVIDDEDFMDVMLTILQDEAQLFPGSDVDTINKATCLVFMQHKLASLLHGFDLETTSDGPIDTSEGVGLTYVKASPLEFFLSPRLSPSLYG
ncbi:hypothetical protein JRO89_XS07G0054700 [Xanthoceras sorbifolium]|uniref:Uncharacterized protein n=1 Tax=Xanthoceras sorbifolium TaxID=99658 RepID=A0ABQ8HSM4_9ROSI|nr:hypothetical protein JRO89_XS07G0054700 [Xanthoceras sorbifolium]